jgi:protein SCO1
MNRSLFTIFTALLVSLSACSGGAPETPPLSGAKMGGAFTLTDQDGHKVSDTQFAGQYRLIYFGYTFCPDVCPLDVQKLMQGYAALEAKDKAAALKIQPIFISVDPARDRPAALKQFVSAFHPRLIGLTGTEAQIEAVAKAYGVYFERTKPDAAGAYLVNHSNNAILYGPKGEPIDIIAQGKSPGEIADQLRRWVK